MSRRAILIAIASTIVFGTLPASAQSNFCDKPNTTRLYLKLSNGEKVTISLERYKDPNKCQGWCVRGGAVDSHGGILTRGIVTDGEFRDGTFYLQIQWQNKNQDEFVYRGVLDKGEGSGIQYVNSQGNQSGWTGGTIAGCDRWPNGPNPIRQQPPTDTLKKKRSGAVEAMSPSPKLKDQKGMPNSTRALGLVPNDRRSPNDVVPTGRSPAARALLGDPVPQSNTDKLKPSRTKKIKVPDLQDTSTMPGSAMDRASAQFGNSLNTVSGNTDVFIGNRPKATLPCSSCGGKPGSKVTAKPAPAAQPKGVDTDYGGAGPVIPPTDYLK